MPTVGNEFKVGVCRAHLMVGDSLFTAVLAEFVLSEWLFFPEVADFE